MFDCVVFDMDGTLMDSSAGIRHAYEYAFRRMGLPFPGEEFVRGVIGAPLLSALAHTAGLGPDRAAEAAACYREYYAARGKREVRVYEGIPQALRELREAGCRIATATLKQERFAAEILKETGLLPLFDAVCGMDEEDRRTKADLIRHCMGLMRAAKSRTILVGDSRYDAAGAREAGIAFLAVTYGFGFREGESLPCPCASSPAGIVPALRAAAPA